MKWITILLAASSVPAGAQWLNYRETGTPRTKDGKPNLSAPAPRVKGRPDLSGVWEAERTPLIEYTRAFGEDVAKLQVDLNDATKYVQSVFWGVKPEDQPLRPEALAAMKRSSGTPVPSSRCLPMGVPGGLFVYTFKMIQAPREIIVLPGGGDPPRQIYTDGRGLPEDPQPAWMGYSVGKWEGDTLVVETTGFTEASWLDGARHPRSEQMRVEERYRRRDFGHIDLEVNFNDPKYYTRQFGFRTVLNLVADSDVLEFVCNENEKDQAHTAKH